MKAEEIIVPKFAAGHDRENTEIHEQLTKHSERQSLTANHDQLTNPAIVKRRVVWIPLQHKHFEIWTPEFNQISEADTNPSPPPPTQRQSPWRS